MSTYRTGPKTDSCTPPFVNILQVDDKSLASIYPLTIVIQPVFPLILTLLFHLGFRGTVEDSIRNFAKVKVGNIYWPTSPKASVISIGKEIIKARFNKTHLLWDF